MADVSELMQAQYRGDRETVERLLAAEPALDIFEAAALGDAERLRELVDGDPPVVGAWSSDGAQPLHFAAFFGHPDACRLLIERGADVDRHARGFNGVAPINSAAAIDPSSREASIECVRILLDAGADPNARQGGGATALHTAAMIGSREMARLLVDRGGDPDAAMDDGRTPRTIAPHLFESQ